MLDEKALDFDFDFSSDEADEDPKKKPLPDGLKPPKPWRPGPSASARSPA